MSADSLIETTLKQHQNNELIEKEKQIRINMINRQSSQLENKRSKKKA